MTLLPVLVWTTIAAAQSKAPLRTPVPINVAEAEAEGRALTAELLSRVPEADSKTNILRIRTPRESEREFPVHFVTVVNSGNWISIYEVPSAPGNTKPVKLTVTHRPGQPNQYLLTENGHDRKLSGNETMIPFAGSDFWIADLGLEFLHWPKQLLLKKELRKGQSCDVLESRNPEVAAGAYSKVISWIDIDSGGIVHADAYDHEGKVLKVFDPSELQKVNGHMQVKEIEMRNRKTGSRSWVNFELQ